MARLQSTGITGSLSLPGTTVSIVTNTIAGRLAFPNNTTGTNNTVFGYRALNVSTSGFRNSAFGVDALFSNQTGTNNTAFGFKALEQTTSGRNTGLGAGAGRNITTGTNCVCIGSGSVTSGATVLNEFVLGNSSVSSLRCQQTGITALSDFRDKTDIKTLIDGLKIIDSVRPVTYRWDRRDWYPNGIRDGSKSDTNVQVGFIAQELKEMMDKTNSNYLNLVYETNKDKLEATPANLFAPLVTAVQELHKKVKALEDVVYNKK